MRAVIAWSSGKDSAWALHEVRRAGQVEVVGALTTVTEPYARVSMHGVREAILHAQVAAAGLPLLRVGIPAPCPNQVYEQRMAAALERLRADGVDTVIFGDLFLADVRAYRDRNLASVGMRGLYPLWGRDTASLAAEMVAGGLRATLVCVDPRRLDRRFAGRELDRDLLAALPDGVDPCGENGEFHTCVWGGPMFDAPLAVEPGEVVERDGFVFADLALAA
jgi:uncharacterized protein (TIGR00290 family)